jgi:hypothetical protein
MSDYFEERKRESQEDFYEAKKRDTAYWQKRKEEKELEDKKRYIEMRQKYAEKYDDRYQNVKKTTKPLTAKRKRELRELAARFVSSNGERKPPTIKPVKKPKPKLTVAQKAARSAKRKRTIKKVYKAVQRFIYGKPKAKRKTTKRKTTKKK